MVEFSRKYRRVLLVEDIEPVLRALTRAIEIVLPGTEIEVARHGFEANERLSCARSSTRPIDLCITDVHLPHMSGLELAQCHAREGEGQAPLFILTTGRLTAALEEESVKLHVPVVTKPFSMQSIELALQALEEDAPSAADR